MEEAMGEQALVEELVQVLVAEVVCLDDQCVGRRQPRAVGSISQGPKSLVDTEHYVQWLPCVAVHTLIAGLAQCNKTEICARRLQSRRAVSRRAPSREAPFCGPRLKSRTGSWSAARDLSRGPESSFAARTVAESTLLRPGT
jgi:hypothetical protein